MYTEHLLIKPFKCTVCNNSIVSKGKRKRYSTEDKVTYYKWHKRYIRVSHLMCSTCFYDMLATTHNSTLHL